MQRYLFIFLTLLLTLSCSDKDVEKAITPACIDGQSQCIVNTPLGELQLHFNKARLVAEQPFELSLIYSSGKKIKSVIGYMEGDNMYMGKIPLFFEQGTNAFYSHAMFGSCGNDNMRWRVWITLNDGEQDEVNFSFTVPSYSN